MKRMESDEMTERMNLTGRCGRKLGRRRRMRYKKRRMRRKRWRRMRRWALGLTPRGGRRVSPQITWEWLPLSVEVISVDAFGWGRVRRRMVRGRWVGGRRGGCVCSGFEEGLDLGLNGGLWGVHGESWLSFFGWKRNCKNGSSTSDRRE